MKKLKLKLLLHVLFIILIYALALTMMVFVVLAFIDYFKFGTLMPHIARAGIAASVWVVLIGLGVWNVFTFSETDLID